MSTMENETTQTNEAQITSEPVGQVMQEAAQDLAPITAQVVNVNGRPCQEIFLPISKFTVSMAEYFTAGEDEDALMILMQGKEVGAGKDNKVPFENNIAYKNKRLEFAIKKIVALGGIEVAFSKEWYRDLPKPDDNVLQKFMLEFYSDSEEKKTKESK